MNSNKGLYVLYGLKQLNNVIEDVIHRLGAEKIQFDIKLLLTEALINAFEHGNNADADKPILLTYESDGRKIRFDIKDSGDSLKEVHIPQTLSDENILDENGRGLFLIKCYSDKVEYKDNTLIIEKCLQ